MKIVTPTSTFQNLRTLAGYPPGSPIIVTNNSSYSVYLVQGSVPVDRVNSFPLGTGLSKLIQGNDDIFISSDGGKVIVQALYETITDFSTVEFSKDMYTSSQTGFRRLRVDVAQTGLFEGRMGEFVRKISSPINYRFTCPVPFILQQQTLTTSEGDIEIYAWRSVDVTPGGTWTNIPQVWRANDFNSSYTLQTTIASGGTLTINNPQNYRDYLRAKTSGATAQQSTVGANSLAERYLNAGTYYVQCLGTGVGSYELVWEERPSG